MSLVLHLGQFNKRSKYNNALFKLWEKKNASKHHSQGLKGFSLYKLTYKPLTFIAWPFYAEVVQNSYF